MKDFESILRRAWLAGHAAGQVQAATEAMGSPATVLPEERYLEWRRSLDQPIEAS